MWKYIEGGTGKKKISQDQIREHFGVANKKCPILELENGHFAIWCDEPLASPKDYPQLSSPAKAKDSGYPSV